MKRLFGWTAALAGVLAGCAGHHPAPTAPVAPSAIITPDDAMKATVAMYNPVGRFVVLNFPGAQMPGNDRVFFIYHHGLKAGEVRITGPVRDGSIVADLVSGEAQTGDEVRDQ